MKHKLFTTLLVMLMSMTGALTFAHDAEIDGIYYNFSGDEATVTYKDGDYDLYGDRYSGNIVIPETVEYNAHTYTVTSINVYAFWKCSGLTSIEIPNSVTSIADYAFTACSSLTSIEIPNSVTSIGLNAFYNTLWYNNKPDGLLYINKIAYRYKGTMPSGTSIVLEEGTKSIASGAFYGCTGLTSIEIPNSVTGIGSEAFYNCTSLTSIEIPSSVTSIGKDAFYNTPWYNNKPDGLVYAGKVAYTYKGSMPSNTSIVLEEGTTAIGDLAFYNCTSLTSIEIPSSVTSIGEYAFCNCSGLTSIEIPNSVTSIGDYTFAGCTGLNSIEFPSSLVSIGNYAFHRCTSLISIEIPRSVTSINDHSFYECSGLASITVESGNAKYDSRNNCNAIIETSSNTLIVGCKNTVIPNNVTNIGRSAFYKCTDLTSIEIPNSVTSIGRSAFSECTGLTSIDIPNSVTTIGDFAFSECRGLTSIEIPSSVTTIGDFAFYRCSSVTTFIVNRETPIAVASDALSYFQYRSVTLYVPAGSKAAYQADSNWCVFHEIKEMHIVFADANVKAVCVANWDTNNDGELTPDEAAAVTDLGRVFEENTTITSFNELGYFTGLAGIADFAFLQCSNLTYITIPNSVTSIGNLAFYKCSNLTSIIIPNGVTFIGSSAFNQCTGLASIEIPSSVKRIGDDAFTDCSGLTSITVESGNTYYDSRNNCNAIIQTNTNTILWGCKNTVIPNSVTYIYNKAFRGCIGLTSIEIPSSVTTISKNAFADCTGLTSIEIPSSVTTIEKYAFSGCSSLTNVKVNWETPISISKSVFSNYANATLYVPIGSKAAYEAADYWKEFKEIVENSIITFADANVKTLCVANWDTNHDGELSLSEAAVVTNLGQVFKQSGITSFNELSYFTGLSSIDDYDFFECSSLTSVTIPNNVTSINFYAFNGCTGLTSIEIPNSVTSIGSCAFHNCRELTSIEIPNSVTSIGSYAFEWCTSLTSVQISSNVTSIGNNAFYYCTGLTSIEIPNSVTSIEPLAFMGCSSLTSVQISNNVTSIGENAFNGCSSLTSIEIPNSVTSIGDGAFDGCSSLTSIEIPNNVMSIGNLAFYGCSGLTSITVESGNTVYDSRNNCNAIIETSGNRLILGCKNTAIPNSVTSIGDEAFLGCTGLTSIEIPNSVTSIGNGAFNGCSSLTDVKVKWQTPISISSDVFSNRANATLFVPTGSKAAYDAADYWKDFKEIEEYIVEDVYYLKNVETGKYLGKGNTWGTHAVLDNEGLPARLVRMPDDSYTLTFTEGSRFENKLFRASGDAVYVDYNNQSDGCPYWTITKAETDGTYYIQSRVDHPVYGQTALPGTYLGNNPEKAALDEYSHPFGRYNDVDGNVTNTEGMNITWQFVPAAERCTRLQMSQILALIDLAKTLGISTSEAEAIAANANKEQVIVTISSLKSSIMQTLRDGASASLLPIDLSALIVNPSFVGNDDGWEGTIPAFQIFNCAEFFETTFDFHQTLTGLPNGKYLLKMKGFHRPGNNQIVYTAYKEGNTVTTAELYANGNSTKLAHHSSGARDDGELGNDGVSVVYNSHTQYVPNSMFGGRRWFDAQENYYVNELPVNVTDGTLTFGVRLDESVTQGWVLFDDFQLEYLGTGITMGINGIATYSSNVDLDFTSVSGLKAYIASGFRPSTGTLILSRVYRVPAGEGLMLKGDPGSYDIPSALVDEIYANLLVGVPTATTVSPTDGSYTNFILANDALKGIGFYPLASEGEIGSNKAYLQLPTSALPAAAARRINLIFDDEEDEVTGISASLNDKGELMNDKAVFDLQGRRVIKPTRGLYIKDGKKFIKK